MYILGNQFVTGAHTLCAFYWFIYIISARPRRQPLLDVWALSILRTSAKALRVVVYSSVLSLRINDTASNFTRQRLITALQLDVTVECWVNCVQSRQVVATLPSHQNYHHDNPSILNTVCSGCGSCIQNSVLHMYVAYIHRCILRTIKIIVATTYRF